MGDHQISEIIRFLESKHIKITPQNEWLQGCCSWFISNNQQFSMQQLQNFVYDQWLLADLREIGEACLPSDLSNMFRTCLQNTFSLQVDSVLNVGESCYSQLQKIRKVSNINLELTEVKPQAWEPKFRRMLKLTCTDGVQTIYGMEYQLIPCLKEPFIPGFKIQIVGPVECRRGVMLLESQNVLVLGGETDSLIVKNATENLLARALDMEENPNPLLQPNSSIHNEIDEEIRNSPNEEFQEKNPVDEFCDDDDDIFLSEQITQVENQYTGNIAPSTSVTETPRNVPHSFNMDNQKTSFSSNSNPISSVRKVGVACPIISPNFSSKRSASSPTNSKLKMAKTSTENASFASTSSEFRTFLQTENCSINEFKQIKSPCIRKCTASCVKLTSKPRIRDDAWQLSAEIQDDTGILDVSFSDSFLEKMFEYTAIEIASQKERIRTNPDIKDRIDRILIKGVHKIMSLKGQFEIEISPDSCLPKVIDVK